MSKIPEVYDYLSRRFDRVKIYSRIDRHDYGDCVTIELIRGYRWARLDCTEAFIDDAGIDIADYLANQADRKMASLSR